MNDRIHWIAGRDFVLSDVCAASIFMDAMFRKAPFTCEPKPPIVSLEIEVSIRIRHCRSE
jgi:hypothetical protein